MNPRRSLTVAVVACAVASAVVLLAASRVWGEVITLRPAPLPPTVTRRSGASFMPWLPALGAVGLAGAGALLATRGVVRIVLGGLLTVCGVGVAVVALVPLGDGAAPVWPVVSAVAGLFIAAIGIFTVRVSRGWPAMGTRFERPASPSAPTPQASKADLWDALDRGEDPTNAM